MSRSSDIILLLGAGASAQAGIPVSQEMIDRIEARLKKHDWNEFQDLYNLVKSSIVYASGIKGVFDTREFYNVEVLVHTLNELERRETHPIYPFISDWKSHLIQVARQDFSRIEAFRIHILNELKGWVQLDNESEADYFKGLKKLQQHLTYPLKIFSLNYMLDFETKQSETLLNVDKLDAPFDYRLKRHGKDEPQPVDLPETFNYLIGLHVASRRVHENEGVRYLVYRGKADGRETAILWRKTRGWKKEQFEADRDFVEKQKLTEGAEDIFVNTDSFIEGARSLDPVFKKKMFNED